MPDAAEIPEQPVGGDLSGLMGLIQQIFGTQNNSTTTDTSTSAPLFEQLIPMLTQMLGTNDYSPDAAVRDSNGQVTEILRQAAEMGLPAINSQETAAGGYNSTSAALLRNDLTARSAGQGAALVAKTKTDYASARTQQTLALIQALNGLTNANRTRTTTQQNGGALSTQNSQRAAAAAAVASLLSKIMGNKKPAQGQNKSPNKGNSNSKGPDGKGGTSSDKDALNEIANTLGYGDGKNPDISGETVTGNGIAQEDSSSLSDRSGLGDLPVTDGGGPSDPNYDPWDLMGNTGALNGEIPGVDSAFTGLDDLTPTEVGDLGSFPDLIDGDNNGDNTDADLSDMNYDFNFDDQSNYEFQDFDFGFGDYSGDE